MKSSYLIIGAVLLVLISAGWLWYVSTQWEKMSMSFLLEASDQSLPLHGKVLHISGNYNRFYNKNRNNLRGMATIEAEEWELQSFYKSSNSTRTLNLGQWADSEGERYWREAGYLDIVTISGVAHHTLFHWQDSNIHPYRAVPLD